LNQTDGKWHHRKNLFLCVFSIFHLNQTGPKNVLWSTSRKLRAYIFCLDPSSLHWDILFPNYFIWWTLHGRWSNKQNIFVNYSSNTQFCNANSLENLDFKM
jgi:hypothetical protein